MWSLVLNLKESFRNFIYLMDQILASNWFQYRLSKFSRLQFCQYFFNFSTTCFIEKYNTDIFFFKV